MNFFSIRFIAKHSNIPNSNSNGNGDAVDQSTSIAEKKIFHSFSFATPSHKASLGKNVLHSSSGPKEHSLKEYSSSKEHSSTLFRPNFSHLNTTTNTTQNNGTYKSFSSTYNDSNNEYTVGTNSSTNIDHLLSALYEGIRTGCPTLLPTLTKLKNEIITERTKLSKHVLTHDFHTTNVPSSSSSYIPYVLEIDQKNKMKIDHNNNGMSKGGRLTLVENKNKDINNDNNIRSINNIIYDKKNSNDNGNNQLLKNNNQNYDRSNGSVGYNNVSRSIDNDINNENFDSNNNNSYRYNNDRNNDKNTINDNDIYDLNNSTLKNGKNEIKHENKNGNNGLIDKDVPSTYSNNSVRARAQAVSTKKGGAFVTNSTVNGTVNDSSSNSARNGSVSTNSTYRKSTV